MTDPDPARLADAHTERPSLAGHRAIVTGGTTGIGRAIAVLLASEGAKVFVCGRDQDISTTRWRGSARSVTGRRRRRSHAARGCRGFLLGREILARQDRYRGDQRRQSG
jgi:NAD(P)-dependent dehydrogenase (short-subunit alcohol dehydrogenase family)